MPQESDALFSSYFPILSQRRIRRGMRGALLDQYRLPTLADLLARPQPRGFAEQQLNTILNAQARLASVGQQPAPPEQDTSLLEGLVNILNADRNLLFGALARAFPGLEQERWFQALREGGGEFVEQELGVTNPIARFLLGTAIDVFTSPLSYLTFGLSGLARGGATNLARSAGRRFTVSLQVPFLTAPREIASREVEGALQRLEKAAAPLTDALRPYFSRGGSSASLPQETREAIAQAQEEVFRTERFIRGISRKEIAEALKPLKQFRVNKMAPEDKRLAFLLGEMDPSAIRQVAQLRQQDPERADRITGLARYMRDLMDEIFKVERQAGLAYRKIPDYLPHLFEDPDDKIQEFIRSLEQTLASSVRGQTTTQAFFTRARDPSLRLFTQAEAAGLKPIYDPERVIAIRLFQSVRSRANRELVNRMKNLAKDVLSNDTAILRVPTTGGKTAPPSDWVRAETLIPELAEDKAVYYLHPEVARALSNLNAVLTNRQEIADLWRTAELAHGLFKGIVTGTPGKVLRDFIGNTFNAIIAGVPPARFLYHFASALRSWSPTMLNHVAVRVGNTTYTWKQLHDILWENNLVSSGEVEEITGLLRRVGEQTNSLLERGTKLLRKWPVHQAAAAVDTNSKLALLREFMQRGMSPEEAAARVRRYLFDYSELTPTEKRIFRNIFPFYTFWRKEMPVLLEGVFSHPELFKAAGYLHEESKSAFELSDDEVPDWIRQNLGIVFQVGDRLFGGVPGLPLDPLASVESPTEGIGDVLESGARYVLSQMTPFVRVPAELAGNVQFYSGAPIQAREGQTVPLGIGGAQVQVDPRLVYLLQNIAPVAGRAITTALRPDVQEVTELPARPEQSALEQLIRGISGMSSFASPFNPERELAISAMLYARRLQDQITNLRRQGIPVPTTDELGLEERPRLGEERALQALTALLQLSRG